MFPNFHNVHTLGLRESPVESKNKKYLILYIDVENEKYRNDSTHSGTEHNKIIQQLAQGRTEHDNIKKHKTR